MATNSQAKFPFVLVILDGYGISSLSEGNAIKLAAKPNIDRYMKEYPLATIKAGGIDVGLPWGEMGNSETGHQNIGSGQVLYQALPRITLSIQDRSFFKNEALVAACRHVKKNKDAALHTIGVLSDGGVHGHIDHQLALLDLAAAHGIGKRTYCHAFLDGRDSPPGSAGNFIGVLEKKIEEVNAGKIASIIGRYHAMDRAGNWERTQTAYDMLVQGQATSFDNWQDAMKQAYLSEETSSFETAEPMIIETGQEKFRPIKDGDAVICYNYRSDRSKQLTAAFLQPHFAEFPVKTWQDLLFVTMTNYDDDLPATVAFPDEHIEYPLSRVFSEQDLTQLHIAEGEKFAHVTHFFNGRREEPFAGEEQVYIPSLKLKDISKKPEMQAKKLTDRVVDEISKGLYDVIIMNYANPDMIAHTGNLPATIAAVEYVDAQLGRVVKAVLEQDGAVLITCDHGNAEAVIDQLTHDNSTDHTNNPVPLIYISNSVKLAQPKDDKTLQRILSAPIGVLADVAPTILDILGMPKPDQMTAQSLLASLR